MKSTARATRWLLAGALAFAAVACGSDDAADDQAAAPDESTAATDGAAVPAAEGAGITIAVNPWTGAAVNANVAKVVLEAQLGTSVTLTDLDEFATWPAMDDGSVDAVLEVWPSGHVADYEQFITGNKSVVDLGPLGASAKIGWFVPKFVVDEHPELATWEGFKDAELAKLFATAESGDLGQFLMGDPSYVTYDEQIIANLDLPLKYVVGGSEAAVLTALDTAVADKTPVLVQFWKPHWKHASGDFVEVALPEITDDCTASLAAADGQYACDYPADVLYKAASAKLEAKNAAAFNFLKAFQLTTDQQNEIAAMVDGDGMAVDVAAKTWVDANPDVVAAWIG